ncbi:hypothetical protein BBI08_08230 [Planococcus halocryophilus]|uniref:Uncharacterized protein n=1 Tax=Planococcus halocryophilus TaxID=1215089 RepID=A0A1C7DR20_9BACL|nr:hypothetical protein BBI08_08230 [Planococcus halocryophilus]
MQLDNKKSASCHVAPTSAGSLAVNGVFLPLVARPRSWQLKLDNKKSRSGYVVPTGLRQNT